MLIMRPGGLKEYFKRAIEMGFKKELIIENLGREVFQQILEFYSKDNYGRIIVFVGEGLKGEVGLSVARNLLQVSEELIVYLCVPRSSLSQEAFYFLQLFEKAGGMVEEVLDPGNVDFLLKLDIKSSDFVIDALYENISEKLDSGAQEILDLISQNSRIISLMIPSGVSPENGKKLVKNPINASLTISFDYHLTGTIFTENLFYIGQLSFATSGIPDFVARGLQAGELVTVESVFHKLAGSILNFLISKRSEKVLALGLENRLSLFEIFSKTVTKLGNKTAELFHRTDSEVDLKKYESVCVCHEPTRDELKFLESHKKPVIFVSPKVSTLSKDFKEPVYILSSDTARLLTKRKGKTFILDWLQDFVKENGIHVIVFDAPVVYGSADGEIYVTLINNSAVGREDLLIILAGFIAGYLNKDVSLKDTILTSMALFSGISTRILKDKRYTFPFSDEFIEEIDGYFREFFKEKE